MIPFLYNYVIFCTINQALSVKLSFIDNTRAFNASYKNHRFESSPGKGPRGPFSLGAVSRTGVCVPEDVALYGKTLISYESLYTKDGRTQTGDEWEAEMTAETKANFPGKTKKRVKIKKIDQASDEPNAGFEPFEIPAPFNPLKMLLRDGVPYLRISCWAPGIKKEQINVFLNYTPGQEYPDSYLEAASGIPDSAELRTYYETCESEPYENPYKHPYHGTYNDLYNRMEKPEYGYADVTNDLLKPPLVMINFPKNTVVQQWERATFASKRDPDKKQQLSRIQRSYRPFSHVDLRDVKCVYKDGVLQLLLKLTHMKPPPEFQKNYRIAPSEEGEIKPPKVLPTNAVHGWMYNWHMFHKYDVSFDPAIFDLEVELPAFVDDMTPRQVRRFMREADEFQKKDK